MHYKNLSVIAVFRCNEFRYSELVEVLGIRPEDVRCWYQVDSRVLEAQSARMVKVCHYIYQQYFPCYG